MYNRLLPNRIAGGFLFRLIQDQQTKIHNKKSRNLYGSCFSIYYINVIFSLGHPLDIT